MLRSLPAGAIRTAIPSIEVLSALLLIAIVILLAATAMCLGMYRIERRELRRLVVNRVGGGYCTREDVFMLARFVFSRVKRNRDPIFLAGVFRPFGGSPLAIWREGGCCSGIHRFFITCLDALGIRAAQVTLYHRSGPWCHCLAQVRVDGRPMLIDVDYGVLYLDSAGEPIGLADLRAGSRPIITVFAEGLLAPLCEGYARDPRPGYPPSGYYDFDFEKTRTANWAKSLVRRAVHRILAPVTRGRIDRVLLSPVLEWPHMILAVCLVVAALMLLIVRQALAV